MKKAPEGTVESQFPGIRMETTGEGGQDIGHDLVIEPEAAGNVALILQAAEYFAHQTGGVAFQVQIDGQAAHLFASGRRDGEIKFDLTRAPGNIIDEARRARVQEVLGVPVNGPAPTTARTRIETMGDGLQIVRGPMLVPGQELLYHPDAAVVHEEGRSQLLYGGPVGTASEELRAAILKVSPGGILIPTLADKHVHAFQPWWNPEQLVIPREDNKGFDGSLPPTLRFETQIRENPEQARPIARELVETMVANGTGEAVVYGTSSIEAMEILLEESQEKFGDRFKTGFVFMNQEINFIDGVRLEDQTKAIEGILERIKRLVKKYPGRITMIDRFPIAVNSVLRQRIVAFCLENKLEYDTHANETQLELDLTAKGYQGRRIIQVLKDDGVFQPGMRVRLAHGIHQNEEDWAILEEAIQNGCEITVVACPVSNGYLESAETTEGHVGFPFDRWSRIGARIDMGTDAGAGVTQNMAVVAATEMGRSHQGTRPTWSQVFRAVTSKRATLTTGAPADYLQVKPSQAAFQQALNSEIQLRRALIAAQNGANIQRMVVGGKRLR